MTKITSSAMFTLFMLIACALTPLDLSAQTPSPLNDNPGTDCLEYHLDVGTLKTNNLQMFWKQKDCIRINVVNNPFRYIYKLTVNETKIAEDDVLGSLGSLLGLKTINSSSAANAAPKTPTPSPKPAPAPAPGPRPFLATPTPKLCDAQQEQTLNLFAESIGALEARASAAESSLKNLEAEPRTLAAVLGQKEATYRNFQLDYLARRQFLLNQANDVSLVKQSALKLQTDSLTTSYSLTGDTAFEGEMVDDFEAARLRMSDFSDLSQKMSGLTTQVNGAALCTPLKKEDPDRSALNTRLETLKARIESDVENLKAYASQIANLACRYKTRKEGEFSWVFDQVYQPVSAVLANPDAFGASVQREGPFSDPTSVSVTLKRDAIIDQSATSIPKADDSILECSSDPSTVLQSSKSFSDFAGLPISQPKAQSGPTKAGGTKPQPSTSDSAKNAANKTQEASTVVFQQPWFFGKARLVVSGGLTTGFLVKQEFQRSSSISGTGTGATSSTVIGLSNNTRYRLAPMLYGHTLLGSTRHEGDAWYATLGVTANSDNKGTDPEFLLGASRSFAQQRFFFTLGGYIGERQKLDGGLQVGQTIPSTLTGELPVTKSYRASWGFGISYRFTSTKDPTKGSSAPAKQATGTPKKTGN